MIVCQITLFQLLREGGWAMYPLGTLSLALFVLIGHCALMTSRAWFGEKPNRWIAQSLRINLSNLIRDCAGLGAEKTGERLGTALQSIEGGVLRSIQYLNVIATIAPMVGLLGTVSGMIGAFQTIATGGMGKPELLAGDIGEALITTATGLTIGIPAMIFYFVMRNRLDSRLEALEKWLEEN